MNFFKVSKGLLISVCFFLLSGCGADHHSANNSSPDNGSQKSNGSVSNSAAKENDANNLINSSALQGSVTDFSDRGCTVSQLISEDGGQTARSAAAGNEDAATTVAVQYEENCTFQTAAINVTTENAVFSGASISDIKKQSSLIIYGRFTDAHTITATKIYLVHYE